MRFAGMVVLLVAGSACAVFSPPRNSAGEKRSSVSIGFYLIHEAQKPGLVVRKIERTGEEVIVSNTPDLSERDIAWATVQVDRVARRAGVLVHLTPIGAEKLSLLTRDNIGRRLAVAVDGKIISTPLIQSHIRDGRATIMGFQSREEAERVAAALARR